MCGPSDFLSMLPSAALNAAAAGAREGARAEAEAAAAAAMGAVKAARSANGRRACRGCVAAWSAISRRAVIALGSDGKRESAGGKGEAEEEDERCGTLPWSALIFDWERRAAVGSRATMPWLWVISEARVARRIYPEGCKAVNAM